MMQPCNYCGDPARGLLCCSVLVQEATPRRIVRYGYSKYTLRISLSDVQSAVNLRFAVALKRTLHATWEGGVRSAGTMHEHDKHEQLCTHA